MRLKPGQTAPQIPPQGPRGPMTNPGGVRAAGNPRTPRDIGFGNGPTGGTRGMAGAGAPQKMQFMGDMLRQQSGMTGGPKPKPSKPAIDMSRPLNATGTPAGRPRAVNTGPRTPPPSTVVNPIRPGMTGGARGNVEQNYRGVPGLVNATAPTPNFRGAALGKAFGMEKGGKVKGFRDGGIYTADMGEPPQDIDGGSASLKKQAPKIIKPKGLSAKQSEAARNESKKELSEFKRRTPDKLTKFKKDDLILTGKDKASFRKGGSIDGIAQRGKTNCKMR